MCGSVSGIIGATFPPIKEHTRFKVFMQGRLS